MTLDTSVDAYHQLADSGKLGEKQQAVLRIVQVHGPLTIRECCSHFPNVMDRSITPRFAELERLGRIRKRGKRACKITGKTVYEWECYNGKPLEQVRAKCEHCDGKGYVVVDNSGRRESTFEDEFS